VRPAIYVVGITFILGMSLDCSGQQIEIELSGGGSRIFSDIDLSHINSQIELYDGYHIESNINLKRDDFPLYIQASVIWNSFYTKQQIDNYFGLSPFEDYLFPFHSYAKILIQTVSLGIGICGSYTAPDSRFTVFGSVALLNTYFCRTNIKIDYEIIGEVEQPSLYEPTDYVIQSPLEKDWRMGVNFKFGTYIFLSQKISLRLAGAYQILNHRTAQIVRTIDYTRNYFPEPELTIGQLSLGVHYQL